MHDNSEGTFLQHGNIIVYAYASTEDKRNEVKNSFYQTINRTTNYRLGKYWSIHCSSTEDEWLNIVSSLKTVEEK